MKKTPTSSTSKGKPKLTVVAASEPKKTRKRSPNAGVSQLTDKQEAFCMAVMSGSSFSEAYRAAYDAENMADATVHREAYRLAAENPKVSTRLEQMAVEKEAEQRVLGLSRTDLVLKQLQEIALNEDGQDGARVRALELLGKNCGLWIDRVETTDKAERSADEIEADIEARLKRLGM